MLWDLISAVSEGSGLSPTGTVGCSCSERRSHPKVGEEETAHDEHELQPLVAFFHGDHRSQCSVGLLGLVLRQSGKTH